MTTSTGPSSSGYGFTGEYQHDSLIYLRARHYAPDMGRFLTRDIWSGDIYDPATYNKWLYGLANPIRFIDPTGYSPCDSLSHYTKGYCEEWWIRSSITFHNQGRSWSLKDQEEIHSGISRTALAFANLLEHMGYIETSRGDVFRTIFGIVAFHASPTKTGYYCERYSLEPKGVICYQDSANLVSGPLIAHEMGHVYNATFSNKFSSEQTPYNELDVLIRSKDGFSYIDDKGESIKLAEYKSENGVSYLERKRTVGQKYSYSRRTLVGEEFADMFVNWVYDGFNCDHPAGNVRHLWMTNRLQADMSRFFGVAPNPKPQICCGE